jgi:UDP-2,3-diacylglucosamine hydrolase
LRFVHIVSLPLIILPDPPKPPTPIGLIAGGGRLPMIVARGLREGGHPIHAVGLAGQFDADLPALCSTFAQVGLLRIGQWCRVLRRHHCRFAIMVGKVDKAKILHDPWRVVNNIPDPRTILLYRRFKRNRQDNRSHALLASIAEELERSGVQLLDSTVPIADQLATPGVMTRTQPTQDQRADIEFVWPMLREVLRLDIGQAISVRERDVIAVEAVEGTDRMIERTGQLCKKHGWTLVKGARAGHDRRADVPTVGPKTVSNLHAAGGRCLALAAGDVIMVDKTDVIELADKLGVSIVGVTPGQAW